MTNLPARQASHAAMRENVRVLGVNILAEWEDTGRSISYLLTHHLGDDDARRRAKVQDLVCGYVRNKTLLEFLSARYATRRLRTIERTIRLALCLGIYQVLFSRNVAPAVAVHQAVATAKVFSPRAAGLVNAVLRSLMRATTRVRHAAAEPSASMLWTGPHSAVRFDEDVFPSPDRLAAYLGVTTSHPAWLVSRWRQNRPDMDVIAVCRAGCSTPPFFLRRNPLKVSEEGLMSSLRREGVRAVLHGGHEALRVTQLKHVLQTQAFQAGWCHVQDVTAMQAVKLLDPAPAHKVLDACAAPGGKTMQLAESMRDQGSVVANDPVFARLARLRKEMTRCAFRSIRPVCSDLLSPVFPQACFDRILLDVPCSNTGVLRRRVELRWRLNREKIEALSTVQQDLLGRAFGFLKPGGKIVYSTCSLETEENERVIERFLDSQATAACSFMHCYYPAVDGGDGGFVARLEKGT